MRRTSALIRTPGRLAACSIVAFPLLAACGSGDPPPGRGAFPNGPNGIAFDAQDRLYAASALGDEIVVVDPVTGEALERLGVPTPDDLAFGPDGALYWTSLETGEVGRLSPQGERIHQFVGRGVNPIAFSSDGRLFVALTHQGDLLYQLDPELVEAPRLVARGLGGLNGMDWGPDDRLYAPVWSRGEVVRIEVDSGTVERVASGFGRPAAVKFDSRGDLHLVDHLTGSVWRIDLATGSQELLARLAPHVDNLAFDSRDRLFVSHTADRAVYEILPGGATRALGARPPPR